MQRFNGLICSSRPYMYIIYQLDQLTYRNRRLHISAYHAFVLYKVIHFYALPMLQI